MTSNRITSIALHPITMYSSLWLLVLGLYNLRILDFYEKMPWHFVAFQGTTVISSIVIVAFLSNSRSRVLHPNSCNQDLFMSALEKYLKKLEITLCLIFLGELIFSGGLPLLWVLAGSSKKHIDFGVPTIHGIFHGLLLFFVTSAAMSLFCKSNIKRNKKRLILFFLYAVLVFNRGIILIALFQITMLKLIILKTTNRLKFSARFAVLTTVVVFIVLYIFGLLGNLRQSFNPFANSISSDWQIFQETIFSPFLWFYAYATGGFNNIVYLLNNSSDLDLGFMTFNNLIPNAFYILTGIAKPSGSVGLADARLTVGTFYWGPLQDIGIAGVFIIVPLLIIATVAYQGAKKGNYISIFYYSVLSQTIIMTPYVDTIFYLPFLLQMATGSLILGKCQQKALFKSSNLLLKVN